MAIIANNKDLQAPLQYAQYAQYAFCFAVRVGISTLMVLLATATNWLPSN